jgi:hypothetical protein
MSEIRETIRIPFRVESQRGDDRLGTNPNTGEMINDHDAEQKAVPFQSGVPKEQVQQVVETQLKDNKWVCLEKQDGSTELLTKKDIPVVEAEDEETEKTDEEKLIEETKPKDESWKDAFNLNAVKPKPTTTTSCNAKPNNSKPKEVWESKFENIKSATATYKGKGG